MTRSLVLDNHRTPVAARVRLSAIWVLGMVYLGSLFRTGYYLVKAALA